MSYNPLIGEDNPYPPQPKPQPSPGRDSLTGLQEDQARPVIADLHKQLTKVDPSIAKALKKLDIPRIVETIFATVEDPAEGWGVAKDVIPALTEAQLKAVEIHFTEAKRKLELMGIRAQVDAGIAHAEAYRQAAILNRAPGIIGETQGAVSIQAAEAYLESTTEGKPVPPHFGTNPTVRALKRGSYLGGIEQNAWDRKIPQLQALEFERVDNAFRDESVAVKKATAKSKFRERIFQYRWHLRAAGVVVVAAGVALLSSRCDSKAPGAEETGFPKTTVAPTGLGIGPASHHVDSPRESSAFINDEVAGEVVGGSRERKPARNADWLQAISDQIDPQRSFSESTTVGAKMAQLGTSDLPELQV